MIIQLGKFTLDITSECLSYQNCIFTVYKTDVGFKILKDGEHFLSFDEFATYNEIASKFENHDQIYADMIFRIISKYYASLCDISLNDVVFINTDIGKENIELYKVEKKLNQDTVLIKSIVNKNVLEVPVNILIHWYYI